MNKETIRAEYKKIRHEIKQKNKKSEIIFKNLKNSEFYRSARFIALYSSLPDEVDTSEIIKSAIKDKKRICLPKISGGEMEFYEIDENTEYVCAAFSIKEPISQTKVKKTDIDLIIVPLICADSSGYRLGFGGGYYDRYLADYTGISVGLCFREQIYKENLPHDKFDIKLNKIITD